MSTLPEGVARAAELVKRSQPKADRPKLPQEFENKLREVDAQMAETYASMEDITDRIERCVSRLSETENSVDAEEAATATDVGKVVARHG